MKFTDIGGGNVAAASRVLCVASADSAPIRRMITEARDRAMLVDCCAGKKCRSVLIMDSDHIVTSALEVAVVRKGLEE
ncbi:MAG: DUF370 domain-containing protein [Saccharofermentans sp.]|jgi:Uncharacterized protein conserved in bacteria|nr:DUF370 domain-containing protein [Saccharofermentans sp.]